MPPMDTTKSSLKVLNHWKVFRFLANTVPYKQCSKYQRGFRIRHQLKPPRHDIAASECRQWSVCAAKRPTPQPQSSTHILLVTDLHHIHGRYTHHPACIAQICNFHWYFIGILWVQRVSQEIGSFEGHWKGRKGKIFSVSLTFAISVCNIRSVLYLRLGDRRPPLSRSPENPDMAEPEVAEKAELEKPDVCVSGLRSRGPRLYPLQFSYMLEDWGLWARYVVPPLPKEESAPSLSPGMDGIGSDRVVKSRSYPGLPDTSSIYLPCLYTDIQ